jgi:hypothetical protein
MRDIAASQHPALVQSEERKITLEINNRHLLATFYEPAKGSLGGTSSSGSLLGADVQD